METEIVYFNPVIPKVLVSQLLKPIWKDVIFSPLGPVVHKKNYNFKIESSKDVLTRTIRGGICGSDLHLLNLDLGFDVTPTIVPSPSPRFMGHECVSEIIELGDDVSRVKDGQRVVVQKGICCYIHQPNNLCSPCEEGNFWMCKKAGQFASYSQYEAAGGWSTGFRYNEQQLFSIPEAITSDQAVLIEPLSCSLRGVLRKSPKENDQVLIINAGTIGLCTLVAIKAVQPKCDITVLARHDFQADLAKKLGATEIIDGKDILDYIVKKTDAVLYKGYFGNKTLLGGFDIIYDCVGTPKTVHNALIWTKGRGTVVIIGVDLNQGKIDLNPIWYQEVNLIGSLIHGVEEWEGKSITTYELVTNLFQQKKINPKITDIITHRYRLQDYKEAIKVAMNKRKSKAIKVIFDYEL